MHNNGDIIIGVIKLAQKRIGKMTVALTNPPSVIGSACVVGKKEGEGPLKDSFDYISDDSFFGESSWEKAESTMMKKAFNMACDKAKIPPSAINYVFAGDLLNQCISSGFCMRDSEIPFFGLYGACSTMGESLALASFAIDGGFADITAAATSSHFCSAERQFRTPLEYGGQRTPTAQWTVTGSGTCVLSAVGNGPYITHVTQGRIVDNGVKDANNMGAAMAPAAYDTLKNHFEDLSLAPDYYDAIFTGDLGLVGSNIIADFFQKDGVDISTVHNDCGLMIFDRNNQDVHSGGSGCGCSASVFCGYILNAVREGRWNRVLFMPTGALLSPTSTMQGESIPCVCTAIAISK